MKRNLYLMYAIAFLQGLVFFGPVSLIFRTQRGLSIGEFFFLEFILQVIVVITEVPWGYFADKYGYKKTLIISYTLFFLSRLSLLFCYNFTGFLGETILKSLAVSGISGCDIAFLYKSCNSCESEKVFGRYNSIGSFAFFISSITSYFIISKSIEFTVLLTVISYGISVIIIFFTKEENTEKINYKNNIKFKNSFKDFKNIKYIFIFVISTALISEMAYGISINLGQLHFENIGIDIKYLGYISALSEMLAMFSCKTYVLSNKFGQHKTLKAMIIGILVCTGTLIFTNNIIISIFVICSISGLISMVSPIILDIKNKSISKNRATILSVYSMLGSIVSGLTYILIGFCVDIYLKYAFIVCFMIVLIGIYGVYVYINKENI